MDKKERRRYPRLLVKAEVEYKESESTQAELFVTGSRDISVLGARIITFKYLPPGTKLALRLKLPEVVEELRLKARVVWIRNLQIQEKKLDTIYEAGVEFLDMSAQTVGFLEEYLKSRSNCLNGQNNFK